MTVVSAMTVVVPTIMFGDRNHLSEMILRACRKMQPPGCVTKDHDNAKEIAQKGSVQAAHGNRYNAKDTESVRPRSLR